MHMIFTIINKNYQILMEDSAASQLRALLFFKCIKNNQAKFVCCNQKCSFNPFICLTENCECNGNLNHESCNIRNLSGITKKLIQGSKISQQGQQCFKFVIDFYSSLIQKLKKDQEQMIMKAKYNGLGQASKLLLELAKSKSNQIDNRLFTLVVNELDSQSLGKNSRSFNQTQKLTQNLTAEFNGFRQKIKTILTTNNNGMLSNYRKIIEDFFEKKNPLKQYKLLFRASEHNFKAQEFHKFCDNIPHTITIIKSEEKKIFGGYTPICWDKNLQKYAADLKYQSFIFTISPNKKFPLQNSEYAIHNAPHYGPTFGGGHDIYLCNQCNTTKQSYGYFPYNYNSEGLQRSQSTYQMLSGAKEGYKFLVEEYEVYELKFK